MKKTEIYKGYTIIAEQYLGYAGSFSYIILDASGKKICDTLWNDDKMWESLDEAIGSAKRNIDDPGESYITIFKNRGYV